MRIPIEIRHYLKVREELKYSLVAFLNQCLFKDPFSLVRSYITLIVLAALSLRSTVESVPGTEPANTDR